jgi:hypothetical protein
MNASKPADFDTRLVEIRSILEEVEYSDLVRGKCHGQVQKKSSSMNSWVKVLRGVSHGHCGCVAYLLSSNNA